MKVSGAFFFGLILSSILCVFRTDGAVVENAKQLASLLKQARLAQKSPNVISGARVIGNLPEVMRTTAGEQTRIQQTIARQGKQSTIARIKLYIGQDEVIYDGISYPLFNGQVNINNIQYVVCRFTIATERQYICCNEHLFPRNLGPISCCGDAFFYTDTESCCGEEFIPNFLGQSRLACCNRQPFVVGQQFCCNNVLSSQPQCASASSCIAGAGEFCCGDVVYRDDSGIRCCRGIAYVERAANCCASGVVIGNACDVDGY